MRLTELLTGGKSYGKRNAITGGTCFGNECSNRSTEKALSMARSTIAAGYCRLMKKECMSIHLLKKSLSSCTTKTF